MRNSRSLARFIPIALSVLMLPAIGMAKNCLWKAESDRGTFYLQGSVHLLKAEDYPLDPAIEAAYAECETLVLETDMGRMLEAETQALLISKAILPGQRTLKDELDPDVYEALSKKLGEAGMTAAAIQKFKPWFASMTLMVLRMQAMGLDPNLGLDQYFHRKALADKKREVGLESVEFQINLFDALSEGNQNGYIRHVLNELQQMETMLDTMLGAWKGGDLEKLDEITRQGFADYPDMYARFVTDRNKDWAEKLDKLANKEKPCMVVVGVAHLAGKEGLLELLKTRGYAIEQR